MTEIKLMVADIYHGDAVSSFKLAKAAGLVGVIHKSSQGLAYRDPAYAQRRKLAADAGLLWGAYHFNTGESANREVETFWDAARPDEHTLMALDFEANKGHVLELDYAREFLTRLDERLGRKAVLYSGNAIKQRLGNARVPFFAEHRLWLCQYGPVARVPPAWDAYWLWQYTDGTANRALGPVSVPGIPGAGGNLDCNHYAGTAEQLTAEWAA